MKESTKFTVLAGGLLGLCGLLAASSSHSADTRSATQDETVTVSTQTSTSVVPSTSTPGPLPGNPAAPGSRNPSNPNPSSPVPGEKDGPPSHP
jgi:hypothetical protein